MSDQFDLDAWLAGASGFTVYAEAYGRPDLHGTIQRLDAELRRERDDTRKRALAEQIKSARATMEGSRVGFTFRGIPADRAKELEKAHADPDAYAFAVLAEQCVEPAGLTPEAFRAMRDAWGEGVFVQAIMAPANQAQQGLGVSVPFSSAASLILSE